MLKGGIRVARRECNHRRAVRRAALGQAGVAIRRQRRRFGCQSQTGVVIRASVGCPGRHVGRVTRHRSFLRCEKGLDDLAHVLNLLTKVEVGEVGSRLIWPLGLNQIELLTSKLRILAGHPVSENG